MFKDVGPLSELMSLLLCLSSRILIEKFHWKPILADGVYDRRNRTVQFAEYLTEELEKITNDETKDIRNYCDETYELYGIRFVSEENNDE